MMKICFIADANHTNTWNWVEFFANDLGHDVSIISFNASQKPLKKVKIYSLMSLWTKSKWRYLFCYLKTRRIVRSIQPDIVIGYRIHSYGFMAAMTGFHPLVLAGQGQNVYYPFNSPIAKYCAKFAMERADLINSWGEHMTAKLIELGCPPAKILTLPRGVRTDIFKISYAKKRKAIHLISTRGVKDHYNIDVIIRACKIIHDSGQAIRLILAGEGPNRKNLEQYIIDLGLQSEAHFVGYMDNECLSELLNKADIYVSMVSTDGVSASLLEAMACGVFPIVTDNVANRIWIEDGENGFLAPDKNEKILAEKILLAASEESLREKAALKNRTIIEQKANWEVNMKIIEKAYEKLIAGMLKDA
jgi:glycosyltransferase involved in cell wall biosynthesis